MFINGYKGRKRKGKNVVRQTGRKRHKKPEDDRVELCTICQKYIPIESYPQHVAEELAEKRKECQIVGNVSDESLLKSEYLMKGL